MPWSWRYRRLRTPCPGCWDPNSGLLLRAVNQYFNTLLRLLNWCKDEDLCRGAGTGVKIGDTVKWDAKLSKIYLVAFRFSLGIQKLARLSVKPQGRPVRHLAVDGSSGRVQAPRVE